MILYRYLLGIVMACAVVTLMFAILVTLIKTSVVPVDNSNVISEVNFIRVQRDRRLELEKARPKPPPEPGRPPPPTQLEMSSEGLQPVADAMAFELATTPETGDIALSPGFGLGEGDGEYLPIHRVPPQYPRQALMDRVEGWVVVEFTIGTEGQVKNPRIVDAQPPGVFENPALQAVQRFRFNPRTMGGEPVEVQGVQNRIRFRLKR